MPSLVVIGAQWGDEGKGKLVDYLTSKVDYVVRFHGGNNAGHTVIADGVTTKLNLIPSGILRKQAVCLLGAGVVVDPFVFIEEMDKLVARGIDCSEKRLIIDRDAHLVMEYHKVVDQAEEVRRGSSKLGTTGRGIGPCYLDRARRCGIRFADLFASDLKDRVKANVEHNQKYLTHVLDSDSVMDFDAIWKEFESIIPRIKRHVGNVSLMLDGAFKTNKPVIFEGAQGTLLDQVHGTVPFVTSSNTLAGAVTTGAGVGSNKIDHVHGIAKAYCTRVGTGPFPTELEDETGEKMRAVGHEFGTVTGRPRRCGWFDAFAIKRAVRLNGVDSLAITKLDVLSGFEKIKVCINYYLDGEKLSDLPALATDLDRVVPEYIELDGWKEDITGATKWHHLPAATRLYLSTISEIIGCPVTIASVGPDREQTLFSSGASFVKNFVE